MELGGSRRKSPRLGEPVRRRPRILTFATSRLSATSNAADSACSIMSNHRPEYPLLAFDTASSRIWVGLKQAPDQLDSRSSEEDPSKSLFALVCALLADAKLQLADLASIAFCHGPGSMLGARAACMAIRTWKGVGIPAAQRVHCYDSLEMGALLLDAESKSPANALLVTDARRNAWHALPLPHTERANIAIVSNEQLERETRPIITFAEFPRWTQTRARLLERSYQPGRAFENEAFRGILRATLEASPLRLRPSEYKKWVATIHSSPAP